MRVHQVDWVARLALIVGVGCLYAGAVQLNNKLLFSWSEFDEFRYLVFLPAGLKLILLMLLGWNGVAGLVLGIAAVALGEFDQLPISSALLFGSISAVTPYLTLLLMSWGLRISYPWNTLTFSKILLLSMGIGLVDAMAFHLGLYIIGLEVMGDLMKDSLPAAGGRILGTFVVLGLANQLKNRLSDSAVPHAD